MGPSPGANYVLPFCTAGVAGSGSVPEKRVAELRRLVERGDG